MCGIVGYLGKDDAMAVVVSGLERLEYRGYDSAGVAMYENGRVVVTRALGKLSELKKLIKDLKRAGIAHLGIGHTRWATHGKPSENNAHPHTAGRISLIHNGIIENYIELREELKGEGCVFRSETDTEIAAHLLNRNLEEGLSALEALRATCKRIRGSYAFLAIDDKCPDRILIAKNATPIIIGLGEGELLVASDIPAVIDRTRNVIILEDGDLAEVSIDSIQIENGGHKVERKPHTISWDPLTAQKGGFKHYMLKEIHDQVEALTDTFRGRIELEGVRVSLPELNLSDAQIADINRIVLVACGTAWHACLVAKFYLEELTRLPCEVDYASEFRYRGAVLDNRTLVIAVSQSGETADTLAAIELATCKHSHTLAVCNVLGSTLTRKVKNVVYTHAGPEISVASTKAFTTQVVALYLVSLYLGGRRGSLEISRLKTCIGDLLQLPTAISEMLKKSNEVELIARKFFHSRDFLYLGRGLCYPIALEGALKLKEISYIHAEGYPAGEMKHGPIALIDENMPVVMLLQRSSELFDKALSNLKEVESRGGRIISVTDTVGCQELRSVSEYVLEIPHIATLLSPVLFTIPLQLLAYYVAVLNGTDVDLPRNLAKSVTVE